MDVTTVRLGKSSFIQAYRVRSALQNETRVEAWQTLVMWDAPKGVKMRMSDEFRAKVALFERKSNPGNVLYEHEPMPLSLLHKDITFVHPVEPPVRFRMRARTRFVDEDLNGVLSARVYWSLFEEGRLYYFGPSGLNLLPPSLAFPFVLHSSNMRYLRSGRGGREVQIEVKTLDLGG